MKKLYMSLLGMALCVAGASAEQTVFIGETGYDNLETAVAAATDGQTITLKGDQTITKRVNLNSTTAKKAITIKGENGAKIVRGEGYKNGLLLLVKEDGNSLTLDGVTLDGNNVEVQNNSKMIEASAKGVLVMNNCKFVNAKYSAIQMKGKVTLNNVTSENCTLPEGVGLIFVGDNNLTVTGNAGYSVQVELAKYTFTQTGTLTGELSLLLPAEAYAQDHVVVKGATDSAPYKLVGAAEGWSLVAKDGNLALSFSKMVVKNETTGVSYSDLASACAAAQPDDVLVVLEDVTLSDRIVTAAEMTIKGLTGNEKITRMFKDKLMFSAGKTLNFQNITFDCNNMQNNNYELEANALMTLENVVIANSVSTKGLINVKGLRTLSINNVTKSAAAAAADEAEPTVYDIYLGYIADKKQASTLLIAGDNNLSVYSENIANTIKVNGDMTNTTPIEVAIAGEIKDGDVLVDLNEFNAADKFIVNGKPLAQDGKYSGIESVAVEGESAAVSVYNMQGVCVRAAVEAAGATADLPAGLYIVGGKKVLVK